MARGENFTPPRLFFVVSGDAGKTRIKEVITAPGSSSALLKRRDASGRTGQSVTGLLRRRATRISRGRLTPAASSQAAPGHMI